MADDGPRKIHPAEPVIVMFIIATVLGSLSMRAQNFLGTHHTFREFLLNVWLFLQGERSFAEVIGASGSTAFATAVFLLKLFSFALSVVLVFAIVSTRLKYKVIKNKLMATIAPPGEIVYGVAQTSERFVNPRWEKVLEHVNSPNPSDWKLAILEADIMLGDMLDKMSYHGATIGDKLKSVEPSDFDTLQLAWEAHKVRNAIAHEGSDYEINKPEAERVIKLFQKVFEEFKFI